MAGLPIAVVLDSDPTHPYHVATRAAIEHASAALSLSVDTRVSPSDTLTDPGAVESYAAVVIGPGSPYRDPKAVLATIRAARERGVPLVALYQPQLRSTFGAPHPVFVGLLRAASRSTSVCGVSQL